MLQNLRDATLGVAARPPTEFEARVYAALREIPRGRVVTYAALAKHLGCGSAQAVGQALRRNPFAPEVPCHRVISTSLRAGGYSGKRSGVRIDRKLRLLREEGVGFSAEGVLENREQLWDWA
ncbi:MAG: MGMT family protein [Akkermansiaceae bacterium]|nr:MGMT family protein [Akkermansiaceae bacterium]